MKKVILLALVAILSFIGLASCSVDFSVPTTTMDLFHIHNYKETVIPPTCTEAGYSVFTCECGDSYVGKSVPATGHKVVVDAAVAKTCTTDGLTEGSHCSVCGEILKAQEVVPASHEWDYNTTEKPTCTSPGVASGYICKVCGQTTDEAIVVPALGHDYVDTVKTTEFGHSYTEHKCSRCSDVYYDSLVVDYTKNYDYVTLTTNELYAAHKSNYQALYKTFYEGCMKVLGSDKDYSPEAGKDYVAVATAEFDKSALSNDEVYAITNSFLNNNPEFYFLDSNMYILTPAIGNPKIVLTMAEEYYDASVREECEKNIKKMEQEVYALYLEDTSISEVDKAKLIHDYIVDTIDYQYDSEDKPSTEIWAHSIMGVADHDVKTGGVCECYAKTYLYLSHLLGLNSIMVVGIANGGGHGWNYTEIDGSWYGVDVTWDDQKSGVIYKYFLASKSTMDDHTIGSSSPNVNLNTDYFQCVLPELSTTSGY